MIIAPLQSADYAEWFPLWTANMEGSVGDDVTAVTWSRLCDPASQVGGLGVRTDESAPLSGICHFILHPTTGNIKPVCYMQDLYVEPNARKQGLARALVTELATMGQDQKWARIYWLAESNNEAAQTLYKSLGVKLDFTLHVLPIAH